MKNKNENTTIANLGVILIVIIMLIAALSLLSCSPQTCPTYAVEEEFECPSEWPAMTIQYDTLVSVQGDTLLYKKPYKPTFLDKAGFVAISIVCIWAIQYNKDERE